MKSLTYPEELHPSKKPLPVDTLDRERLGVVYQQLEALRLAIESLETQQGRTMAFRALQWMEMRAAVNLSCHPNREPKGA